jgi:hypothetical protein
MLLQVNLPFLAHKALRKVPHQRLDAFTISSQTFSAR